MRSRSDWAAFRELRSGLVYSCLFGILLAVSCGGPGVVVEPEPGVPGPETVRGVPMISVLVMTGRPAITLEVGGNFTVRPLGGEEVIHSGRGLKSVVVKPAKGGFLLGPAAVAHGKIRLVPDRVEPILVDGRRFTGEVVLLNRGDAVIDVVDRIDLETYLCGVLQGEIPAGWPADALMAQAVASRTYALFNMRARQGADFDVDGSTRFQVYVGGSEPPFSIAQAVEATRGLVMESSGRIFEARFCSSCGGATENNDNVFREPFVPALAGRPCGYCSTSPDSRWEAVIDKSQLTAALKADFPENNFGPVRDVTDAKTGTDGRIIEVTVRHANGTAVLNANDFRLAVISGLPDKKLLRSMHCRIVNSRTTIRFTGSGWGHGVGMCQWGARGMAAAGYDFRKILAYYYTGSTFQKLYR